MIHVMAAKMKVNCTHTKINTKKVNYFELFGKKTKRKIFNVHITVLKSYFNQSCPKDNLPLGIPNSHRNKATQET